MKSPIILVHVLSLLGFSITSTPAISLSKPSCQEKCGTVTIPFPFGIGSICSANSSFTVVCENSTTPILSSIKMEVLNISLYGTITVNQPVTAVNCSVHQKTVSLPISFEGSPFTISTRYNSLAVIGCTNSVWLLANNKTTTVGGCTAMCDDSSTWESSCNGVNCCQTTLPPRLKQLDYTYKTTQASNNSDNSSCGFVLPVDKRWLKNDYISYKPLDRYMPMSKPLDQVFKFAPLVLEWEFGELRGYTDRVCTYSDDYCLSYPDDFGRRNFNESKACLLQHVRDECRLYPSSYVCKSPSDPALHSFSRYDIYSYYYGGYDYVSSIKYCSCPRGYQGNPYLPEGCIDIDECNATLNACGSWSCINVKGDFRCEDQNAKFKARLKLAFISIGSGIGALILLLVAWKSTKAIGERIKARRRHKFFRRNGGLLLEQQLAAADNGIGKTKLYSSEELTQATDHYNENRIIGCGGQGTVYKGMLKDGKIVAVKKSKKVEEGDLQVFINEVVILSQVNHRNVVKLLGCCLETEVPLLVYEFIPNGTLFQQIHEPNEEFPLTWEMRVRIASEVAASLAYLHSDASAPIYHRDIKSTNILLDDKYRAKVSDFGISRSIGIDKTHLTTRVQGTFGYFDPQYFQSSHFTDKSDVYSFGVVMVELLTGEKALSSRGAELGRNLAMHFVDSMEENQLFEIIDARVLQEGKREEITAVAHLARRCLHPNGKRRPTMKEVAAELEGLKELEDCFNEVQNQDDSRECHPLEVSESQDFSSTSGSMHSDSIAPDSPKAHYPLLALP